MNDLVLWIWEAGKEKAAGRLTSYTTDEEGMIAFVSQQAYVRECTRIPQLVISQMILDLVAGLYYGDDREDPYVYDIKGNNLGLSEEARDVPLDYVDGKSRRFFAMPFSEADLKGNYSVYTELAGYLAYSKMMDLSDAG